MAENKKNNPTTTQCNLSKSELKIIRERLSSNDWQTISTENLLPLEQINSPKTPFWDCFLFFGKKITESEKLTQTVAQCWNKQK